MTNTIVHLPQPSPSAHNSDRWEVPLSTDPGHWPGVVQLYDVDGAIGLSGVPDKLRSSRDARHLAAALLAAADRQDELNARLGDIVATNVVRGK